MVIEIIDRSANMLCLISLATLYLYINRCEKLSHFRSLKSIMRGCLVVQC